MIDRNELKTGNYLYFTGEPSGPVRVAEAGGSLTVEPVFAAGRIQPEEAQLEPLFVIGDVLERSGFVNQGNGNFLHRASGLVTRMENDTWVLLSPAGSPDSSLPGWKQAGRYTALHVLQNLFSAETGQELRIELTPRKN